MDKNASNNILILSCIIFLNKIWKKKKKNSIMKLSSCRWYWSFCCWHWNLEMLLASTLFSSYCRRFHHYKSIVECDCDYFNIQIDVRYTSRNSHSPPPLPNHSYAVYKWGLTRLYGNTNQKGKRVTIQFWTDTHTHMNRQNEK